MEEQGILTTEVGTKETERQTLKPARVKIVNVKIEHIEKAKSDKAVFEVLHPDREIGINISSLSYIDGNEIVTGGTWVNLDEDDKLQKGSALATLMKTLEAKTIQEIVGREIDTVMYGKYLCFKCY